MLDTDAGSVAEGVGVHADVQVKAGDTCDEFGGGLVSILSGHGVVGFAVGGVNFDKSCGYYGIGGGTRNERGDGDMLWGIMSSLKEEDRDDACGLCGVIG